MWTEPAGPTPSAPVIREADDRDSGAIAALLTADDLPLDGLEDAAHVLVAETAGTLVGVIALERHGTGPDAAYLLRSAAVDASQRGRGTGTALVQAAVAIVDRDHAPVALLTQTAPDYFPRFGFRAVGRAQLPSALAASVELQGVCSDTAVAMLRPPP